MITTPELSTNGMLPKAWRRINNEVILYKGSTFDFHISNSGFEPYSEYYASQIADILGYNHVSYDLDKWKNRIVSTCPLFTSLDISYVQIADVVNTGGIKAVYEYINKLGFNRDFANLILFDAVVGNLDRHYGNFGLLRDNNTGKFLGLAPIFDNGESLLSKEIPSVFLNDNDFLEVVNSVKYDYSYYDTKYVDLIKLYCNKEQIKDLRKLLDFKINRHSKYNLDENRIKRIEEFVHKRAMLYISVLESNC